MQSRVVLAVLNTGDRGRDGGLGRPAAQRDGLQKRFSRRWQTAGQYRLSRYRDFEPQPEGVGFELAPDFGGEWTLGVGDQRHRAVFNGIHENDGNYITVESNRNYGRPTATAGTSTTVQNVAYQSRSAQFGFRIAF